MHVGLVVTPRPVTEEIWSGNQREHIQYLRILVRKTAAENRNRSNHPRLLVTESGVGYRLQARLEMDRRIRSMPGETAPGGRHQQPVPQSPLARKCSLIGTGDRNGLD